MLYDECDIGMNLVIRLFSVRRNKYYLLYFYILICACARETLTAKRERERGRKRGHQFFLNDRIEIHFKCIFIHNCT